MFKRTYKFVIMKDQTEEAFNSICELFNVFGKIADIEEAPLCETKNPEHEICKLLIFTLSMKKKHFTKMIGLLREAGLHPKEIKGYWMM